MIMIKGGIRMAKIRVNKNKNFTTISNFHLRDINLSLKAKGLLTQMLSLPDGWDYTLAGLAKINKEGVDGITSAIKELEKYGYVTRKRVRDEKGRVRGTDYTVYEQPVKTEPLKQDNPEQEKPILEKPIQEKPIQEKPEQDNPIQEKPVQEKPRQLNTYILNTDLSNTNLINQPINQSINNINGNGLVDVEKYNKYLKLVKRNIEFDILSQTQDDDYRESLSGVVSLIADFCTFTTTPVKINGNLIPAELVKSKLLKLDSSDIEYVLHILNNTTKKITNPRVYTIAVLYNAKDTKKTFWQNEVNYDIFTSQKNKSVIKNSFNNFEKENLYTDEEIEERLRRKGQTCV